MTRRGKIARLPQVVRDELNLRIFNGEPGRRLVKWLNGLEETKRVMAEHFGGRKINEPNLSEWKAGGYQDWLAQKEMLSQTREWMAEVKELTTVTDAHFTDHLATVVGARYAVVMANWREEEPEKLRAQMRVLRAACEDINGLRKGDQTKARLTLAKEQLEWEKEKIREGEDGGSKLAGVGAGKREMTQEEMDEKCRRLFGVVMREAGLD